MNLMFSFPRYRRREGKGNNDGQIIYANLNVPVTTRKHGYPSDERVSLSGGAVLIIILPKKKKAIEAIPI